MPTSVERAIHDHFLKHDLFFKTHIDNYLKWIPFAAVAIAHLSGVKTRSSWRREIIVAATTEGIRYFLANGLKNITTERRPIPYFDKRSFPSGHASAAFSAAQFMHRELKESFPYLSSLGYVSALAAGFLRLMKNRH